MFPGVHKIQYYKHHLISLIYPVSFAAVCIAWIHECSSDYKYHCCNHTHSLTHTRTHVTLGCWENQTIYYKSSPRGIEVFFLFKNFFSKALGKILMHSIMIRTWDWLETSNNPWVQSCHYCCWTGAARVSQYKMLKVRPVSGNRETAQREEIDCCKQGRHWPRCAAAGGEGTTTI